MISTSATVSECPAAPRRRAVSWRPVIVVRRPALTVLLFACGFLAVQRFTLGSINALVCAVPLGLFGIHMLRGYRRTALSCLTLALFFSVDNGGGLYAETPMPLRYLIYVSAIVLLFYLSRRDISRRMLVTAALLLVCLALGSLISAASGGVAFDAATLRRDLMALFIVSAFLLVRNSARLDLHLLNAGALGYLGGEALNALFFYNAFPDYLSYDSLKAFIVFPLLYAMMRGRHPIVQLALAAPTLYVVFLYGTRMITLSIIGLFAAAFVIGSIRRGRGKILLGIVAAAAVLTQIDLVAILNDEKLVLLKALSFITVLLENFDASDIFQMFQALDPVRFAEHQLFFSRSLLQIIFGSGLGSGVFDARGLLGFVTFDQTAFTVEEIRSSIFFNLHDFWIDYGLRFGLLPVAYLIYRLAFREMLVDRRWQGVLFGILLINTTFATSGLLLTSLIIRFFPRVRSA